MPRKTPKIDDNKVFTVCTECIEVVICEEAPVGQYACEGVGGSGVRPERRGRTSNSSSAMHTYIYIKLYKI